MFDKFLKQKLCYTFYFIKLLLNFFYMHCVCRVFILHCSQKNPFLGACSKDSFIHSNGCPLSGGGEGFHCIDWYITRQIQLKKEGGGTGIMGEVSC